MEVPLSQSKVLCLWNTVFASCTHLLILLGYAIRFVDVDVRIGGLMRVIGQELCPLRRSLC